MKTIIALFLCSLSPIYAHGSIGNSNNRIAYESKDGYAYENKCFRFEYKEYYVPGNSISRGYVKSYNEKISVPCDNYKSLSNHPHYQIKPKPSYTTYKPASKCASSTTLGGLIGGGLAASLSRRDAYGWSIPLGAVLGAGIGNAECQ